MFINLMTMNLHIAPNRLISEIQEEFNKFFPFLKLDFFNNKLSKTGFSAKQILPHTKKIGDSQVVISDGNIEIDEKMKVNELEKILKDQFSLAVQVFRKSGKAWFEITGTDSWTLAEQNCEGEALSVLKN